MGRERKARELGVLERSREGKDARGLLLVNCLCLVSTPPFGRTAALSWLEAGIRLAKSGVYERIGKGGSRG
jgi:hypothetical protein